MTIPRLVIAGTQSGVGKTSIAVGLVRLLTRKGLRVQTFKVGPDFLDPTYLALASGRPCYNLDSWMCGKPYALDLFLSKTADADFALIEGVMGLFDGASPETSEGSTAEIARLLVAPILLVANAKGAARSFAATIKGFHTFERGSSISGVIANQCGSQRHASWLADALRSASLPPLIGAVSQGGLPVLPTRHLGLLTANKATLDPSVFDSLADALERQLEVQGIIALARHQSLDLVKGWKYSQGLLASGAARKSIRIGIAEDKAFHFYYPDNLEALVEAGASLLPFSPLADAALPDNLDALSIGGGYPEEHAEELGGNAAMRNSVRQFVGAGGALYAECGGLMYASQGIETSDGGRFPMLGILPVWTRMRAKRKVLGYVEARLTANTLLGKTGFVLRGHEFHYSELVENSTTPAGWKPAYELRYRRENSIRLEGFLRGRVLASYAHIHFASNPKAAESFVRSIA